MVGFVAARYPSEPIAGVRLYRSKFVLWNVWARIKHDTGQNQQELPIVGGLNERYVIAGRSVCLS
ncbi:hypothetical protein V1289_007541 [Bradyrhizobium sp. AZCC 2289]